MRMVVLIGPFDFCSLLLFAPRIPLRRPIGILPDLCTIIERAMYTDDQSGNNDPNVVFNITYFVFTLSLVHSLRSARRGGTCIVVSMSKLWWFGLVWFWMAIVLRFEWRESALGIRLIVRSGNDPDVHCDALLNEECVVNLRGYR